MLVRVRCRLIETTAEPEPSAESRWAALSGPFLRRRGVGWSNELGLGAIREPPDPGSRRHLPMGGPLMQLPQLLGQVERRSCHRQVRSHGIDGQR